MAVIAIEELVFRKYENDFVLAGDCTCVLDKLDSEGLLEQFNQESTEKIKKMTCQARNRLVQTEGA